MKIAIIGMGRAGRRYQGIAIEQGYNVLGYDVRPEFSCGLPVGEVLKACDVAIIATPPETHLDYALLASTHGCPALIEKPISHNTEALESLDFSSTLLMPVTTYRFHPTVWLAKFEAGENPYNVKIIYRDTPENWEAETYERDADLEARIHFVDLLHWLGGEKLAKRHRELIELDFDAPERVCRLYLNDKPYDLDARAETHRGQFRHFISCAHGKEMPICTIEDAIEILRIALT